MLTFNPSFIRSFILLFILTFFLAFILSFIRSFLRLSVHPCIRVYDFDLTSYTCTLGFELRISYLIK